MNNTPLEQAEQMAFVQWLEIKGYKYSSIPNSTFTKSWAVKRRNKDMGLHAGLPDLLIIVNDRLVFTELKREKGGTTSKEQKEWIEALNKCTGVHAEVAKGCDEAIKIIEKYSKIICL